MPVSNSNGGLTVGRSVAVASGGVQPCAVALAPTTDEHSLAALLNEGD